MADSKEEFKEVEIYCGVGKVIATLLVPASLGLAAGVGTHVEDICKDCQAWSPEAIGSTLVELEAIHGELKRDFGKPILRQSLVDEAQFVRSANSNIIIFSCNPTD